MLKRLGIGGDSRAGFRVNTRKWLDVARMVCSARRREPGKI